MAAGNAIIGALRAVLGIDTAQFETGLKSAQSHLAGFGAGVAKAGAAGALAFAAAGAAVAVAVKGAIEQADKLNKASQKIGVPVEELSALKFAAELSDVSMESLTKSMGKLSKAMVEAAAKPTSEAANAFKALGVSVTDGSGKLKSSSAVLQDIAEKFEGLKDGAGKTAVSMALFGKSGAELIPLLNAGRDGIKEMMEEARQLGIVIDKGTAESAEKFNDNLKRLGAVKDGIITKITAGMLPALENLSKTLVDGAKNTALMNEIAGFLSVTLQGLVSGVIAVGAAFKVAFTNVSTIIKAISQAATGDLAGAWRTVQEGATKSLNTMTGAFDAIKGIWVGAADGANKAAESTDKATKSQRDFNYTALAGKTALDQIVEAGQKQVASLKAQAAGFGLNAASVERLRFVMTAYQQAVASGLPQTDAWRAKITETGNAIEEARLKLEAQNLILASLPPHEAFRKQLENNEVALRKFGATAEMIAQVQQATAERYGNTWGQVGESVAGSFVKIGQTFSEESRSMALVAKVAGIAQATISMFVGAAKALELPFPANLAAWATVLAQGATAVAGIKAVSVGKFAMGGAFRVPGGIGGGDRVPVSFMAEPGELVEVTSNRADGYRPDRAGGGAPVVRVPLHGRVFDRDTIGEWITAVNAAIRDGYRLELEPA